MRIFPIVYWIVRWPTFTANYSISSFANPKQQTNGVEFDRTSIKVCKYHRATNSEKDVLGDFKIIINLGLNRNFDKILFHPYFLTCLSVSNSQLMVLTYFWTCRWETKIFSTFSGDRCLGSGADNDPHVQRGAWWSKIMFFACDCYKLFMNTNQDQLEFQFYRFLECAQSIMEGS